MPDWSGLFFSTVVVALLAVGLVLLGREALKLVGAKPTVLMLLLNLIG
ncbi:hypothetical protein ACFCXT_09730 [Streptomyces vinaceus]